MYRSENTTGDQDLIVDSGELSHYEPNDSSHEGDHVDAYATYSLNGHSTLPERYTSDACPDDSPVDTVEAYSSEHDVSVCVSIPGPSADDLEAGVAK
jgi:predicted class III extradiol MEMO1 family dioxygenase